MCSFPRSSGCSTSRSCRARCTTSASCPRTCTGSKSRGWPRSRSCFPSSRRSIRAGARRASTRRRRCAMNEARLDELVLRVTGLAKTFGLGKVAVPVLKGIDLDVRRGESLAIVGASGSGKSTLLHLLGGLDRPSSGTVTLLGEDFSALDPAAQGRLRNRALGFVYQFHHLLPEFSALENVAMPLVIRHHDRSAYEKAAAMLEEVGLGHRLAPRPGQLLGREGQPVAEA